MSIRSISAYCLFFVGALLLQTCKCGTVSQEQGEVSLPHPITYSIEELDKLYRPLKKDTFILSVGHDEFRAPIEDLFSLEERIAHKTKILECTWRLNEDSLLTVWYLPIQESLRVLGQFTYPPDAIF